VLNYTSSNAGSSSEYEGPGITTGSREEIKLSLGFLGDVLVNIPVDVPPESSSLPEGFN
jgi:hypothetical protein